MLRFTECFIGHTGLLIMAEGKLLISGCLGPRSPRKADALAGAVPAAGVRAQWPRREMLQALGSVW